MKRILKQGVYRIKCPYCDWETIDVDNRSGMFETHLKKRHNMSKNEYIKEHPEDKDYFKAAGYIYLATEHDKKNAVYEKEYI